MMTDVKMKIEEKNKADQVVEFKAGQAVYMAAVTHQTSNVGDKPFTVLVTEIK